MIKNMTVLLIGTGGYGRTYYEGITKQDKEGRINIVGIVEPYPEKCSCLEDIRNRQIPMYERIEDFYAKSNAELAVISSPIQFHCEQVCYALQKGSHVLCEKPISATVQDANKMIEARNRSGKVLAIGYQWSYSDEIQKLKNDILKGVYGKARRLKTAIFWPRTLKYYSREWAGKKTDITGQWILDSIANNATAHYLHNMFYVTGKCVNHSSVPNTVQAELYRANDIENFDTAAVRIFTREGIEMMFFATHAVKDIDRLFFHYEFENGEIVYEAVGGDVTMTGRLNDGTIINYGEPVIDSYMKLTRVINQIQQGEPIACGPEAAFSQILCLNGMQESVPEIFVFPDNLIKRDPYKDSEIIYVEGLDNILMGCYQRWALPGETEIPWARTGEKIELTNYEYYPGGKKQ